MPEAEGVGPALRYTKDGAIAWIAADNPQLFRLWVRLGWLPT